MNRVPAQLTKTVLITGCSKGGIGDALAQAFHKRGLKVFATARNLSKIEHLKTMGMSVLALDIVDPTSVKNVVEVVKKATGGTLDFLVNNAGAGKQLLYLCFVLRRLQLMTAGYSSPLLDVDIEKAEDMFETNLFGRVKVTQAFTPLIMRSKGTILNIGSIAGYYPFVWQGMYGASCAAVHQWSDVLRIEMEPFDVKVILVYPPNQINITHFTDKIQVITGAISTHFLDNLPTTKIQDNSIYTPAKSAIEALMNGTAVAKNYTSAGSYAEEVVKNAVSEKPKKRIWVGGVARTIWAASTFFWATAWVSWSMILEHRD